MGEVMGNNPLVPSLYPLVIFVVMWALMALVLYGIIRFGVKHGMRSYYAEAARRAVPADGVIGAEADGPSEGAVEGLSGGLPGGPAR